MPSPPPEIAVVHCRSQKGRASKLDEGGSGDGGWVDWRARKQSAQIDSANKDLKRTREVEKIIRATLFCRALFFLLFKPVPEYDNVQRT